MLTLIGAHVDGAAGSGSISVLLKAVVGHREDHGGFVTNSRIPTWVEKQLAQEAVEATKKGQVSLLSPTSTV